MASAADVTSVLSSLGIAPIASPHDYNRDGIVSAADKTIVLGSLGAIIRINIGAAGPFAPQAESGSSQHSADAAVAFALTGSSSDAGPPEPRRDSRLAEAPLLKGTSARIIPAADEVLTETDSASELGVSVGVFDPDDDWLSDQLPGF